MNDRAKCPRCKRPGSGPYYYQVKGRSYLRFAHTIGHSRVRWCYVRPDHVLRCEAIQRLKRSKYMLLHECVLCKKRIPWKERPLPLYYRSALLGWTCRACRKGKDLSKIARELAFAKLASSRD